MITYPVDVKNTRWSLWSISQSEIIKHNKPWPVADGGPIPGLDTDLVPLLEVVDDRPAYDQATQQIQQIAPVVDIEENTHTHGWEIVPRPQEEIDADAEREQAKAVYKDLMNGNGTQAQRLQRVEKVCAYLLKEIFGAN